MRHLIVSSEGAHGFWPRYYQIAHCHHWVKQCRPSCLRLNAYGTMGPLSLDLTRFYNSDQVVVARSWLSWLKWWKNHSHTTVKCSFQARTIEDSIFVSCDGLKQGNRPAPTCDDNDWQRFNAPSFSRSPDSCLTQAVVDNFFADPWSN